MAMDLVDSVIHFIAEISYFVRALVSIIEALKIIKLELEAIRYSLTIFGDSSKEDLLHCICHIQM